MTTIFKDLLSSEELHYLNTLPEVLAAKTSLDSRAVVYFSVAVTDSIRAALEARFGITLTASIPMRWIKGDTAPHIDRGASNFDNTYLVYLNNCPGEFILDSQSYPIEANTGFVFNEGISHETQGTENVARLLLGPMNEMAEPVGVSTTVITYYSSLADLTNSATPLQESTSYAVGSPGGYTSWRIGPGSTGTSIIDAMYTASEVLESDGVYYLYPFMPIMFYFATEADAINDENYLGQSDSYTVGIYGGYTTWMLASSSSGTSSTIVNYATGDTLNADGTYYLYASDTHNVYYYNSNTDAMAKQNLLGATTSFTVGAGGPYGPGSGYTTWIMAANSTGSSGKAGTYANDDILTNDGIYFLYPQTPINIAYYPSEGDANSNTNMVDYNGFDYIVSSVYTNSWRISSNSTGTSSQSIVYTTGDTLNADGLYYLYPAAPCFLEGSKILCQVEGVEMYVPVEELKKGTLVKTSLDGYKPVFLLGKGSLKNPGNDERTENRLYKCSPSSYPELKDDLYITGCHSILEFPITDKQKEDTIKHLGKLFVTDKKYRLMACVDERAEPWNSEGVYTIWHFALENADDGMNYGVYANGLLVETCSIRSLKNKSNMTFTD